MKIKKVAVLLVLSAFIPAGCEEKPNDDLKGFRQVVVFFSTKSLSSFIKSTATSEENSISKIILFGANTQGKVVESYPAINNPPLTGTELVISEQVKSLYAVANPSEHLEAANPLTVSDLLALTGDFTGAPVSPFLMSGYANVKDYNVNIELVRAIAKITVSGEDGFQVQSVTVKNTPAKGFVFAQPTIMVPAASERVNYAGISNAAFYVAESGWQNPATLTVKGTVAGRTSEVPVGFFVDGKLVDIVRNTSYLVVIGQMPGSDYNISITIREWDDKEIDRHYFNE